MKTHIKPENQTWPRENAKNTKGDDDGRKPGSEVLLCDLCVPLWQIRSLVAALLLAGASSALAEVHYVDVNNTNATPPYTNWTTAATTIQGAVDAAVAGDEIVVANGLYATGWATNFSGVNRVAVDKPLKVRSVNGPQFTTITGGNYDYPRCVYLSDGASLSGFTLTGGYEAAGGGVFCEFSAVVSNCVVSGNGAVYDGGGAYGGTLNNCTLIGNTSGQGEGGLVASHASGGGASNCRLNNCTLNGNSADGYFDGYGGGAYDCTLYNCTLTRNSVSSYNGWNASGGGAYHCFLLNCIVYSNIGDIWNAVFNGKYDDSYDYSSALYFCFTRPLPTGGIGNITTGTGTGTLFVENFRLQSNSPCINAGNNSYVTSATDLDGNPRIVGGTVDIGAYEFQSPASLISYAWLQQFNLPINPATDTADPDGDGVDNYHEWLARSDPINPLSSPAQLTIIPSGTDVILSWSTNAVGFTLQSTTNLVSPSVWTSNSPAPFVIGGQNVVTNPISGPQQFFRLVQ